jgi:hypothetical protein
MQVFDDHFQTESGWNCSSILTGAKEFSLLQNLQIDSGAHGAYYLITTRVPSQG